MQGILHNSSREVTTEPLSENDVMTTISSDITDLPHAVCSSLLKVLKEGADVQRCAAAKALGSLKHEDSVEPLIEALLDEDPDVRADVAEALARIKSPKANKQLLENFIGDPDTDVKRYALRALIDMRYGPVQEWLEKLLREEDDEIQWDVVDFFDREWDDREDFRVLAIESIGLFKGADAIVDIKAVLENEFAQDMMEVGFRAMIKIGDEGIREVGNYLDGKNERQRRRAAAALAASSAPAAEQLTNKALQDDSLDVRLSSARVLAKRNAADPRLRLFLVDKNPQARAEGLQLCGRENPEWVERMIDDNDPLVQISALTVIAENPDMDQTQFVGEAVRERLLGREDAPSPDGVVIAAVKAYVALGIKDASDLIAEIAEDSDRSEDVRLAVVDGLGVLGGEKAVNVLSKLAADDHRQIRLNTLAALTKIVRLEDNAAEQAVLTLLAALQGELVSAVEEEPVEDDNTEDASNGQDSVEEDSGEEDTEAEDVVEAKDDAVEIESVEDQGDEIEAATEDRSAEAVEEEVAAENQEEEPEDLGPTSTLDAVLAANKQVTAQPKAVDVALTADELDMLENVQIAGGRNKGRVGVPHPYDDVRRFAARVLGDVKREDVTLALTPCLRDGDRDLATTVADSIARIAEDGAPLPYETIQALIFAFQTGERDLRMQALRGLANDTGAKGPGLLGDGLKDEDPFVRIEALRGLGNRCCAGQDVVDMLDENNGDIRLNAARAIAKTAGPDALDTLAKYAFAFEAVHRRQAAGLMKKMDAKGATLRMIEIIEDQDCHRQWQAAVEVLDTLHNDDVEAFV